jgi:hypothetical protein
MIAEPHAFVARRSGLAPSRVLGPVWIAVSLGLLLWSVRAAGAGAVADAVSRVGVSFVVVLTLGGLRFLARAAAWRLCLVHPSELPLTSAFSAVVSGNAIGSVTPLGALVGEPSKVFVLSADRRTREAGAALAVENLCYILSVLVVIAIGAALLLIPFGRSAVIALLVFATAGSAAIGLAAAFVPRRLRTLPAFARALADAFWTPRGRLMRIAALEAVFHVAAVAEVSVVVSAMAGLHLSVVSAAILEVTNRVTTILFHFVPMRLGVDEALSGMTAQWLRLGAPVGVGLAVVRKGRILCWSAIGLALALVRKR